MKAIYSVPLGERVQCLLCPHKCIIAEGQTGFCKVRRCTDGELESLNAFRYTSAAIDPIEKKPLYHFHPGSKILSLGSFGCNLACSFCQNSDISKEFQQIYSFMFSTEEMIAKAVELKRAGNIGIAFTYNEPIVWYETVLDCAKACKEAGLSAVLVTNGYIEQEPLDELLPYIDAMNIDLKAFTDSFYKKIAGGTLPPVLETIRKAAGKCHVEITTLIIPGLNDSEEQMVEEAEFLAVIDPEIPLHLTRFFPRYKMLNVDPTPIETLQKLSDLASEHLNNVHIGNV